MTLTFTIGEVQDLSTPQWWWMNYVAQLHGALEA